MVVWAGLVYLVEEDIFVGADFFAFHRAVQGGAVAGLGPTVDAEHWALVHSVMAHNLDVRSRPSMPLRNQLSHHLLP